jgi:uncharacterized integral membrane protein (TIGR00697 family)
MENNSPKYYDLIVGLFVAVLLITQTIAQKIVSFGPLNLSAGVILFPVGYIFGDVLTEVYGYARSRRVIWIGFAASALMAAIYWLSVWLPAAPGWPNQESFQQTLGFVPRIVVASLIAYWAGEFSNSYILAKLKVRMNGKKLWVRTIGSTIVGEAIDTIIVVSVAFGGVLPGSLLVSIGWSIYLVKVLYEIAATPLTYLVVARLKQAEGIDHYDVKTKFNPFVVDDSRSEPNVRSAAELSK